MSWLLALDGATERLALALVAPDGRVLGREQPGGAQASGTLLPAVQALMQEAGVVPAQLAAIGFGQGPGAFTGLRSICAVVQGLAWGWSRPVLALDSLLLVVEDASLGQPGAAHWGALVDARMGELYAARYQRQADGDWHCLEAPGLWAPDALRMQWQGAQRPEALAGNGGALWGEACAPERARAEALGRLCQRAWRRGEARDAAEAVPLYVRDKVALTTAEREAAAAR